MPLTLSAARMLRNGGIDACAALNSALIDALTELPADLHKEAKLSIGRAMAAVLDETVNKAVAAFPELEPDEKTWLEVVKSQARKRATE